MALIVLNRDISEARPHRSPYKVDDRPPYKVNDVDGLQIFLRHTRV